MKKLSLFLILTLFGYTAIGEAAQSKGAAELTAAPDLSRRHAVGHSAANAQANLGPSHNARLAIAPYAQVVPNSSYTFIGVSHPSLATAHTSIGLVIEAMGMTHPTQQSGNGVTVEMQRAVAFTVDAGQTHRVFIVNEGHAIINSLNAAINDSNTHIIETKSDENQFGNIRVTSVGTNPNHKSTDLARVGGVYKPTYTPTGDATEAAGVFRYDNLNQLAMWGVVYQESNGAGFSLEFIGDMHDSSASGTAQSGDAAFFEAAAGSTVANFVGAWKHPHRAGGYKQGAGGTSGVGRGVN